MNLAIVVGGWHWPLDYFEKLSAQAAGADLFVVAHRNPELPIVREEKLSKLFDLSAIPSGVNPQLFALDQKLYRAFSTVRQLRGMGWEYQEEPNTIGDWGFFNQWLVQHDWRRYDAILNCHDDNWIRRDDLVGTVKEFMGSSGLSEQRARFGIPEPLMLSNGKYPQAPAGYVRGSFEVWSTELLNAMNGNIDLGAIGLTRVGKTDSPADLGALSAWNDTCVPLRDFMVKRGWLGRLGYMSNHYRVSRFLVEGERGFLHYQGGAPWSFNAGLEAFPIQESELA